AWSTPVYVAASRRSWDFSAASNSAAFVRARPLPNAARAESLAVLFVSDVLHPLDHLAVELLLDCDVGHGRGRRGTVPVLFARRKPDHVPRPDFLDRAAPPLCAAAAGRHDQRLAQRVGVPRRPGAGLERDTITGRASRGV